MAELYFSFLELSSNLCLHRPCALPTSTLSYTTRLSRRQISAVLSTLGLGIRTPLAFSHPAAPNPMTDADIATAQQNGHGELVKPIVDTFDYRFITLSNGLRCLLVSDPEADKAAACLDVSAT